MASIGARILRRVPLLNGLPDARPEDHREAFVEVAINIAVSTIPIWFGAFIMLAGKNIEAGWFALINRNINDGELFLYSTALLGPLFYFALREYEDVPNFPSKITFILSAGLILMISVGLFAVQRVEELVANFEWLDHAFVFDLSWKVYIASIALIYLGHVYKNVRATGAAQISGRQTHEFVSEFIER